MEHHLKKYPHERCTYLARLAWWTVDHENEDPDFTPELIRARYLVVDHQSKNIVLRADISEIIFAQNYMTLYDAKSLVNEFQKAELPKDLMSSSPAELLKLKVLVKGVAIDSEGQPAAQWRDEGGEPWVEILMFEHSDVGAKSKVIYRYEVFAKGTNGQDYWPEFEMNAPKLGSLNWLLYDQEGLAPVSPIIPTDGLREKLVDLLKQAGSLPEKATAADIDCIGMLFGEMSASMRIFGKRASGLDGTIGVDLTGESLKLVMPFIKKGKPVQAREMQRFFETENSHRAVKDFNERFR